MSESKGSVFASVAASCSPTTSAADHPASIVEGCGVARSRAEVAGELVRVEGRLRLVEEHLPHPRRLASYRMLRARRGELLGELAGTRSGTVPRGTVARVAVARMLLGGGGARGGGDR